MARRSALLIAASDYEDPKLPPLTGPLEDVRELRRVLGDPKIGAFEVEIVENESAHELQKRLYRFITRDRTRDDTILVHFSCHGLKDDMGNLFFAAADTQLDLLEPTSISASWLNEKISESRSNRIVLTLDCCFAGVFARRMAHRASVAETVGIQERFEGKGHVVLTAANSTQYAFEAGTATGRPQPSFFTKAVVKGLEFGDADADADGTITIDELYDYVLRELSAQDPPQTPTKAGYFEGPELAIASSGRRPPVLVPDRVRRASESDDVIERLGAVVALANLRINAEAGRERYVVEILQRLAEDDSTQVRSQAARVLHEFEASESAATVGAAPTVRPTRSEQPAASPDSFVPETVHSTMIVEEPPSATENMGLAFTSQAVRSPHLDTGSRGADPTTVGSRQVSSPGYRRLLRQSLVPLGGFIAAVGVLISRDYDYYSNYYSYLSSDIHAAFLVALPLFAGGALVVLGLAGIRASGWMRTVWSVATVAWAASWLLTDFYLRYRYRGGFPSYAPLTWLVPLGLGLALVGALLGYRESVGTAPAREGKDVPGIDPGERGSRRSCVLVVTGGLIILTTILIEGPALMPIAFGLVISGLGAIGVMFGAAARLYALVAAGAASLALLTTTVTGFAVGQTSLSSLLLLLASLLAVGGSAGGLWVYRRASEAKASDGTLDSPRVGDTERPVTG